MVAVIRGDRCCLFQSGPGYAVAARAVALDTSLALVLGLVAETPDITIDELRGLLAGRGLGFGYGTIQRFLIRHNMTRKKKTGHASEQDRPDGLVEGLNQPLNRAVSQCVDKDQLFLARIAKTVPVHGPTNGAAFGARETRQGIRWRRGDFLRASVVEWKRLRLTPGSSVGASNEPHDLSLHHPRRAPDGGYRRCSLDVGEDRRCADRDRRSAGDGGRGDREPRAWRRADAARLQERTPRRRVSVDRRSTTSPTQQNRRLCLGPGVRGSWGIRWVRRRVSTVRPTPDSWTRTVGALFRRRCTGATVDPVGHHVRTRPLSARTRVRHGVESHRLQRGGQRMLA